MKVTDVQGNANHGVCVCIRVCAEGGPLFWIFALIKLDFPIDENVHLNVNTHISRPPMKYGGLGRIIRMSAFVLYLHFSDEWHRFVSTEQIQGEGLIMSTQYSDREMPEMEMF